LIDEDLVITAQTRSFSTAETSVVGYSVASESAQTFVAVATADHTSQLFTMPPVVGDSTHELQYDSDASSYNFAEVALAADATHLVVASINTFGCSSGQVHVGLSDLEKPFEVRQDKDPEAQTEEESNIALGVDLDAGHCTGATRKLSATGVPSRGATHPAVASLGTKANEQGALLVWLGTATGVLGVAGNSIPVEALGLTVPSVKPVWLNGRNRGSPTLLGHSTSLSAPAVLALEDSGRYLVAFPAELGIQLLRVPPDPSTQSPDLLGFLAIPAAEQVMLAFGNAEGGEVGIAWRTGSEANAQVCFTVLSNVSQLPVTGTTLSTRAPVCQPAAGGGVRPTFAPQLLYRDAGFAEKKPRGGWFLSWVDAASDDLRTFHVSRVREESMNVLGDAPRPLTGLALVYPSDGDDESVGYASIPAAASDKSQPETIPSWCQ
jgi:hypothetical protein